MYYTLLTLSVCVCVYLCRVWSICPPLSVLHLLWMRL